MYTPEDGEKEPDWVQTERKQFSEFRDTNKVKAAAHGDLRSADCKAPEAQERPEGNVLKFGTNVNRSSRRK